MFKIAQSEGIEIFVTDKYFLENKRKLLESINKEVDLVNEELKNFHKEKQE